MFIDLLFVIRQCCEMLDYLGVPYVQSAGEAEAMCAFLNKNHVSDTLFVSVSFYQLVVFKYTIFFLSKFLVLYLCT